MENQIKKTQKEIMAKTEILAIANAYQEMYNTCINDRNTAPTKTLRDFYQKSVEKYSVKIEVILEVIKILNK